MRTRAEDEPLEASKLTDFRDSLDSDAGGSAGAKRDRRTFMFLLMLSFFKLPVPFLEPPLAKAPGASMLSSAENELLKLLVDMLLFRLRP